MRPPFEVTPEQWDEAFQSQSRAFFFGVRSAVPVMRDGGRIIAVSYWPGSHGGGFLPQGAQEAMFAWLRAGWSPSGRAGTPEDIGGAVAALCGGDAAWITGQTIAVDGGASLMNPEVPLDFQRT